MAAWLAAHPNDLRLLDALDESLAVAMHASAANTDVDAAFARVRPHLATAPAEPPRRDVLPFLRARRFVAPAPSRRRWVVGGAVAASVVALLILGTRTLGRFAGQDTSRGVAGSTVATKVGARDSVRLSDGTRVILAPGSRVAIAANYGRGERRVEVHGEAWFDVQHDASRPFVVVAGDAIIRDLGTAFVVRTDGLPQRGGVIVLVTQGRVSLAHASATETAAELAAGDRGELTNGRIAVYRGTVGAGDVAWTSGKLTYQNAPLTEVGADLQRWYGVTLRIPDSTLAARRLTATFENDPAERVLAAIAAAIGATIERSDTEVVLHPVAGARR